MNDVFNPGGIPTYTYSSRSQLDLEVKLKEYLIEGHKVLSLSGPTKSGKTVLCRQVIPKEKGIWISGGNIRDENDFWQSVVDQLNIFTEYAEEEIIDNRDTLSYETSGGLSLWIAKAEAKANISESKTQGRNVQVSRQRSLRMVATDALSTQSKPVIVDDFHYVERGIQASIIKSLKNAIFENLRLVLISVPNRANDAIKIESEMEGRVKQLKIPRWTEQELKEIPEKGFKVLNISQSKWMVDNFPKQCFGNPQLMQEFCRAICKEEQIYEPVSSNTLINLDNESGSKFFQNFASEITSGADYERLERSQEGFRREYILRTNKISRDSERVTLRKAVLIAMANIDIDGEIPYEDLRISLKKILWNNIPNSGQLSKELIRMQNIVVTSGGMPRLLQWDSNVNKLHILDSYFKYYLKWVVQSQYGLGNNGLLEKRLICKV